MTAAEKLAYHREWMAKHPGRSKVYYRHWREKHPKKPVLTEEERFWSKVAKSDGCWEWIGAKYPAGYGAFTRKVNGKWRVYYAHRAAYEYLVGSIPTGLTLDHLCRNRPCVNPAHLEPVTKGVNTLRGLGVAALNARKTHCKHGHELAGDNVSYQPANPRSRVCRECRRQRVALWAKSPEGRATRAAGARARYLRKKEGVVA